MKWYCKYCMRTINKKRKKQHQLIRRHKIKARWHKYFSALDSLIDKLNKDYESGMINVNEYNKIENEIYEELDELDDMNYFNNLPDDSDGDDE